MIYVRRDSAQVADEGARPYLVRVEHHAAVRGGVRFVDRHQETRVLPAYEFYRDYEPLTVEKIYSWIEELAL